ncbi:MAG TPA: ABC transporter permease [Candidatus Saccharimonadales bacterium]|nr:ABC transporter permease [Candidatus Saccharimonadales bacterium]
MNSRNTSSVSRIGSEFKAAFLKDLRSYVRYPAWLLGEFISTPLWFFFFALGVTLFSPTGPNTSSMSGFNFFYFGFIFIILFSTAVWGIGQSVRNEQQAGTLEQFFLAPVNRVTLIVGRWARVFLTDILIVGYTTVIVYALGNEQPVLHNPALFFLSLGLYEVGLIGFGLFFAGLTMRIKSYNTLSNMVFFGYMILTGALFPISVIPVPFRYISMAIPFTYFIDLMRNAALSTSTILPESFEYLAATILAVSMLLIGFAAFNKIEEDARVRGTISAI